jgi:hypothetical protein
MQRLQHAIAIVHEQIKKATSKKLLSKLSPAYNAKAKTI